MDGQGHGRGHGSGHDAHGNPAHIAGYVARLESPERAAWQRPDEVVAALRLRKGMTAADVGAGSGYFARRIARAVGGRGRVYAVDVDARLLAVLRERMAAAGARNVTPVLALGGDPLLPERACDLVLSVNMLHHVAGKRAYLARLARALKPRGRIAVIDFEKRELPMGPPVEEKLSREQLLAVAEKAGLLLAAEHAFLPYQYFLVFTPRVRAPSLRRSKV